MSYSFELSELVDNMRELKQKKRDLQLVANDYGYFSKV